MHSSIPSLVALVNSSLQASERNLPLDESARSTALSAASKLKGALQTPEEALFEHAFMPNQFLCTRIALDLDLFNLLTEDGMAKTAAALAGLSGGDALLINRILRVLSSVGFVAEVGEETYGPTAITKALTEPTRVAMMKHSFDVSMLAATKVPQYFRNNGSKCPTGTDTTPFQYAMQTDLRLFPWLKQRPDKLNNFNTFMQGNRGSRPRWIDWFPVKEELLDGFKDEKDAVALLDIGGGRGHDLAAARRRFPEAPGRFVLQDLPQVISSLGDLGEGIEKTEHDFFMPQPIRGARCYFFHFVIHDWYDHEARTILQHVASAMKKGYSKLLLNEIVLPDQGANLFQSTYDIQMMILPSGLQRTRKQWQELAASVGLEVQQFWLPPGDGEGIVELMLKD